MWLQNNHSDTSTFSSYFQSTWKLTTTYSYNSWKRGILKQVKLISIVKSNIKM
jgi:hypothetical protein